MYGDGFRFGLGSFLKVYFVCFRQIPDWQENNTAAPFWRFFYDFEEGAVLTVNGRRICCSPEKFYIIPGFVKITAQTRTPFRRFYIHFSPGERVSGGDEIYELETSERELELIHQFTAAGNSIHNTRKTMLYAMGILAPVLLRLPPEVIEKSQLTDPRIENTVKYINEHCAAPQSNAFLARNCGMSRNGFLRLFEQETGVSPQYYWRKKRIEQACELLMSTPMTIDEIAEKTGFADRYHFSRVFSAFLKKSPAKFRKEALTKSLISSKI